jgi:hypothetical protein
VIGNRLSGVADVRQRWRDCLDVLAASARQGDVTRRGATLQRGSAWCRSRCPRVIAPCSAASLSVAIAICARSSCRAPALFRSDQQTGRSIALDCGSRLRRNAYHNVLATALANKWLGSLGLCWHKIAATKRASSRKLHRISVFGPADVHDATEECTATPAEVCELD